MRFAAESESEVSDTTAALAYVPTDEDRQFASDVLVKAYHEENCEYDGMEDGAAVCAGECRDFAQTIAGVEPSAEACS